MLLVSMQANQALLIEGTRHPRWLSFTVEHTDNYGDHCHFGEALAPNSVSGFNIKMKETFLKPLQVAIALELSLSIEVVLMTGLS